MADEVPPLDDDVIEWLRRLAAAPDGPDGQGHSAKLTDVVSRTDRHAAESGIARVARDLTTFTGRPVELLKNEGKRGTFVTPDCRCLGDALKAIARTRAETREAARRRRRLDWLQLTTCLDGKPLSIGAYQAHAERFLATAVQLMVHYFPWLTCSLSVEENRIRSQGAHGVVRQDFDDGAYDFILVPQATESRAKFVYEYSFRVIGTEEQLSGLRDKDNVIDVHDLRGQTLIVAPPDTSSRQRLEKLMRDAELDVDHDTAGLLVRDNPAAMRLCAVSGQGMAIMSDEYTIVGASSLGFPCLGLGLGQDSRQRKHAVEMGLLRHRDADQPRHQAFEFVIQQLVEEERKRPRAAAQA